MELQESGKYVMSKGDEINVRKVAGDFLNKINKSCGHFSRELELTQPVIFMYNNAEGVKFEAAQFGNIPIKVTTVSKSNNVASGLFVENGHIPLSGLVYVYNGQLCAQVSKVHISDSKSVYIIPEPVRGENIEEAPAGLEVVVEANWVDSEKKYGDLTTAEIQLKYWKNLCRGYRDQEINIAIAKEGIDAKMSVSSGRIRGGDISWGNGALDEVFRHITNSAFNKVK